MTMSGGPTFVNVNVFASTYVLIMAFQPMLFHTIVTDGHYMLCSYRRFFYSQLRAELFDCGVANDISKVRTSVGVHRVDTKFLFC